MALHVRFATVAVKRMKFETWNRSPQNNIGYGIKNKPPRGDAG